jgi:hypothetical protein
MVAHSFSPFIELIHYLSNLATPQQILDYRVSDDIQERAKELTDKNKDGHLSELEAIELEQMIVFNQLLTHLKVKADAGLTSL